MQLGLQASGQGRQKQEQESGADTASEGAEPEQEPEPASGDRLSDPSLEAKVNDLQLKEPDCKIDEEKRRSARRRE